MHQRYGQRDAGLVRVVTSRGLAASLINCIVGVAIFAVPADLAASVGLYAPIAFLVCAIAISSVAICWAEGGSRIPTSGGAYGYIEVAFGPFIGYIAGTILWVSSALGSGAITAALADVVASQVPKPWAPTVHAAAIVAAICTIAFVNFGGASRGTRLVEGTIVIKLIPIGLFLVVGAGALHGSNFVQTEHLASAGIGRALILAAGSLMGMEVALSISGEVTHPAKAVPRAIAMSLLPVTLLYIAIQIVGQGILGPALAHTPTPLADAMAVIHPTLRWLILGGSAVSMFGSVGSDLMSTPRILFAMAIDGKMPRALRRVNPWTNAPQMAIICYSGAVILLALTGAFAELFVLSTLATAMLYALGSAAAWRLARHGVATAGPPLRFRYLTTATVIAIVSMFGIMALGSRAEILGVVGLIASSGLLYVLLNRLRRPI